MTQDIQKLLQATGLDSSMFEPGSRYYGKALARSVTPEGETVVHTTRRFVPSPQNLELLRFHLIEQGDRLDNLAHRYLGDAQQFWRICDANGVDQPDELTAKVGARIRIGLPEGRNGRRRCLKACILA